MAWTTFYAAPEDFPRLLERMLHFHGAQIFEVYSEIDNPARNFARPQGAADAFQLGVDPVGKGIAAHCALWVPAVMPHPSRKRINLREGGWRESIEGCGLFWLQAGGVHGQSITESRFGWFTLAASRRKYTGDLGPEHVNWDEHKRVATELTRALRELQVRRAQRFPVLSHASRLVASGYRLLGGPGMRKEIADSEPSTH